MRSIFFILMIFVSVYIHSSAQIIAPNAKLILIDSSFSFTEGPATDKAGNVFFTDQPNDNIWKYDINGKLSLFMHGAHRSNGMYFDVKGNLISCADENNELISISPNKKITAITNNYNGAILNGPNDVWVNRSNGSMYITDPYYQRDYWTRKKPDSLLGGERVYFLPAGKKQLLIADSSLTQPNGITGTPDGRYLYVADIGKWKTWRFNIQPDGSLANKQLFADEGSDGMTIDAAGNIYLTNNGVSIYDSLGKKIQHIDVPEKWTANVCFSEKYKDVLFITASKSVYIIQTVVKGVE
jgi:gluconolactonase